MYHFKNAKSWSVWSKKILLSRTQQVIEKKKYSLGLKLIKNKFQPGTIILFDEFYGFPNWEKYEYKAFKEEIEEN